MTDVLTREVAIATSTIPIDDERSSGGWARALRTVGRIVLRTVVSFAVVIGVWMLLLRIWDIEDYLIRGPIDVWNYLRDTADSEARAQIASDMWITMKNAGIGLLAGTAAGVAVAILFNLYRPLEQGFTPVALVLRSTPLVAMAPLISLVFGRGLAAVAVVGGIVTFFPTLVNVSLGLREVPAQTVDLLRAYGAGRRTMMLKAQIPTALPALFAALRAAAPLAITGALISEWLITGTGMGASMNAARNTFEYDLMWTEVAITTLGSLLIYSITVGVEGAVLARFAPDRARAAKTGA
jgi:ABC-type nitrate/sulfonate/bicarbonate transport system permease component